MPTIKEYLGALITSVNQGRVLADVESANIAQMYAQDPLLKHFPVPRFRASEVELSIPVAIEKVAGQPAKEYQPIDVKGFNTKAYQVVKDTLKVGSFERKLSQSIQQLVSVQTSELEKSLSAGEDVSKSLQGFAGHVANGVVKRQSNASNAERKTLDTSSDQDLRSLLTQRLYEELKPEIRQPAVTADIENASIIVEAARLREINSNYLIHIRMKLSEEGMEWSTMTDEDGEVVRKLLPE
ncbi:MAG: hypothetical protein KDD67_09515 [Ignavibacteriae bacterium]|nr:hypothetical protein [Ignavibacteriota bacterium]MCB9215197.1 hypothetical protein [Ignavibacteria bacterium]